MRIVQCVQGTPEWHAARIGLPTASRFADVMATLKSGDEAAGRRNYRVELVVERLTGKPTEQFLSKPMRDGIEREPLARIEVESKLGRIVGQPGFVKHDTIECGASPDGMFDERVGLEIKCPTQAVHFEYLSLPPGKCPSDYWWQVQGGMWITGASSWAFSSFNPDFPSASRLIIRWVQRDDEAIRKLESGISKFIAELDKAHEFALNYKEPTE